MPVFELDGRRPRIHPDAYIAPTAVLIGDVELGAGATIWFGAVVRGDGAGIRVGAGSNIQDNAVIHVSERRPTVVGENVTIGHLACIEGCLVEDGSLVGTGSIMLQGSRLGAGAVLAAGAVLGEDQEVPAGKLAAGVPAVVKGAVSAAISKRWLGRPAIHYQEYGRLYRAGLRSPD